MPRCKNIDHNLRIIFLHPNRCGGKSIEKIIFNRDPVKGSADHSLPKHFVKMFGEELWHNYYKFGFSRNPWDRSASLYFYRKNTLNYFPFSNFYEYLCNGIEEFPHDFITQSEYFFYKNSPINFIGKIENYQTDFLIVRQHLKINKDLPQLNRSKNRSHYRDLFDNTTKNIVEKWFYKDISNFGYIF